MHPESQILETSVFLGITHASFSHHLFTRLIESRISFLETRALSLAPLLLDFFQASFLFWRCDRFLANQQKFSSAIGIYASSVPYTDRHFQQVSEDEYNKVFRDMNGRSRLSEITQSPQTNSSDGN
ncbi:hypothetical protein [Glaciimonas soli]|uniref:Uncharacterized protein n=1 Tax=Glaciimonas soli TaxID=2590999 RepID=A0A843YTP5_9BURK|nr:hypothetical protein [Glaciimonas soli]MQR00983.1 hypothetical protein [Glaciimonas soli]